jgi:hypothetical protein
MKVTLKKSGHAIIPKGWYRLHPSQNLHAGDRFQHPDKVWVETKYDKTDKQTAGLWSTWCYIRKLEKKRRPVVKDATRKPVEYRKACDAKIPRGYRPLGGNEKLRTGDLFPNSATAIWLPTKRQGELVRQQTFVSMYIRKV